MTVPSPRPSRGSVAIVGRVLSVSGAADAEAVVVRDGRIEAVGPRHLAEEARAAGIPVRDVGSRTVVPGFVDPHIHLELMATARMARPNRVFWNTAHSSTTKAATSRSASL